MRHHRISLGDSGPFNSNENQFTTDYKKWIENTAEIASYQHMLAKVNESEVKKGPWVKQGKPGPKRNTRNVST